MQFSNVCGKTNQSNHNWLNKRMLRSDAINQSELEDKPRVTGEKRGKTLVNKIAIGSGFARDWLNIEISSDC